MEHTFKTMLGSKEVNHETTGEGIAQASMIIILTFACLVGIWGVACMMGAAATGNGPEELIRGYVAAVTGL